MSEPAIIRRQKRRQRNQLSNTQQAIHQQAVIKTILRSQLLHRYHHFGIYLHNDAELHTDQLIDLLWQFNKQVYLPILHPRKQKRLFFSSYSQHTVLIENRFGILQPPLNTRHRQLFSIDVIFMPLVAFDSTGTRLGMGGGFYDRSLSRRKLLAKNTRPLLIGLAHALQFHPQLRRQPWDIPLDAVITEQGMRVFNHSKLLVQNAAD